MSKKLKNTKRIKLLILLMLVTIVLMLTATYAWFSTQRDVEITGMRINVEVAESMQISLNGEKWAQSIEIADMRQFYGTYDENANTDSFPIYQAEEDDNTNYVPTKLLPVSTAGEVSRGKLQFVQGELTSLSGGKAQLGNITLCNENDITTTTTIEERENGLDDDSTKGNENHPYLVFDMYLRNISARTDGNDPLKMNIGSSVWVNTSTTTGHQEGSGVADTGLEYSARIGMIVYGQTVDVTETGSGTQTVQEKVREIAPNGTGTTADTIIDTNIAKDQVAIWEPNYKNHTQYVVANNGRGITSTTDAQVDTYGIKTAAVGTTIENINAQVGDADFDSNLEVVKTFKPIYSTVAGGTEAITDIISTDGTNSIGLQPNKISKVRVYIWLEGQDPDCVDLASTGDKLNVTLKLTKDKTTKVPNSYVGEWTENSGIAAGTTITASNVTSTEYGASVTNYDPISASDVGWKIFHSDGTNIYLIADDYIERQYVPKGIDNIEVDAGDTSYEFGFQSIVSNENDKDDVEYSIENNNPAKKWLGKYTYGTRSTNNMISTSYLINTSIWSGFKDGIYADYAIGSPTIELFATSYNATHSNKKIETNVSGINGYLVKWSDGNTYTSSLAEIDSLDGLYVIESDQKASGMWIASPSGEYGNNGVCILEECKVYSSSILGPYYGVRPVVALKPGTKLQKQANGSYLIVD